MSDNDKWSQRRLRHCKQYGIKSEVASEKLRSAAPTDVQVETDSSGQQFEGGLITAKSYRAPLSRTRSLDRTSHGLENFVEKRESVFQMACKGFNSVLNGDFFRRIHHNGSASRGHAATVSRIPTYVSVRDKDRNLLGFSSFPFSSNHIAAYRNSRCETTPAPDETECQEATAIMIGDERIAFGNEEQPTSSTNFFLHTQVESKDQIDLDDDALCDVLFFEQPQELQSQQEDINMNKIGKNIHRVTPSTASFEQLQKVQTDSGKKLKKSKLQRLVGGVFGQNSEVSRLRSIAKFNFSIRRGHGEERPTRKWPMYGKFDPELIKTLKDGSCDYRPYFTYWISTVQTLILFFMILNYGIGTDFTNMFFNPFDVIERSGDVMTSSLSAAHIVVWEQNNIWIGPKFTDLIHAGAKYTPCMRRDEKIYDQILKERLIEAEKTGCCIGPWGCYQTSECPKQFANLLKWVNGSFPESDYSRVVCGQDPRYCVRPRSLHPVIWGNNLSNWPICEQRSRLIPKSAAHMHCDLTGRPCCIQMHGQCRIASREYCDFVGGYYHENATLCSQVSCLNDVCGMSPFVLRDFPDQIYRLITPLFIHAGIIRCAISLYIYLTIMRRFEIMIGWLRLSTIYFISGIGGYLASAVFVPYMPEVGPVGSEGGILGALIVNICYNWDLLTYPYRTLFFHVAIAGVLFILGFLPWIDNWAQLFGFVFGSLMAIVLIPYITIRKGKSRKRLPLVIGSLCVTVLLFSILTILFLFYPINYELPGLLNCPIPTRICDLQGLILKNWLPI